MLMSPRKTLKSCGSSSSFHFRSTRPNGVTLLSFAEVTPGPVAFGKKCMLRNFSKSKHLPFFPQRRCRNKAGPVVVARMSTAITAMIGKLITSSGITHTRSSRRLRSDRDHVLNRMVEECELFAGANGKCDFSSLVRRH